MSTGQPDGVGMDETTAALIREEGWPVHLRLREGTSYPTVACDLMPYGQVWSGLLEEVTCHRCQIAWKAMTCQVCTDPVPDGITEQVQAMVREALADQHRIIEAACERALQEGKHGVLILRAGPGGTLLSAEPDESVPYGEIHDRPLP